jgi:predicted esterase
MATRQATGAGFDTRRCGRGLAISIWLVLFACRSATDGMHRNPESTPSPEAPVANTGSSKEPSGAIPALPSGVHSETVQRPDGTTLRYTISVPAGDPKGKPLIVMLHYGGEVTPFYGKGLIVGFGPAFDELQPILIAPDSLGGDWTTTDNEAAVVWLTRAVMATYRTDPRKVVLSGYSMGGMGTWFIGARHQDLFTVAVPIASAPVDDSDWKIPLYVIHSHDDEILPIAPVSAHVDQLKARGARVEWRPLRGPTHYNVSAFVPALRDTSRWLAQLWAAGDASRAP